MSGTPVGFPCVTDPDPTPGWDQPLTPDQFRMLFPAFADDTTYPDAMIQTWLNMCPIDPCVWGSVYQLGMGLWVGHEMTKFGPNGLASLPGQTGVGIVNNKSVDSVSIGYDTQMGADPEAGQYNMTLYGRQFWSMLKYLPIGPIQIGPGGCPGYYSPTSGAWIGPWPFPGPAQSGFSS